VAGGDKLDTEVLHGECDLENEEFLSEVLRRFDKFEGGWARLLIFPHSFFTAVCKKLNILPPTIH